jgi:endonuclease YncB( thermonuclease family)
MRAAVLALSLVPCALPAAGPARTEEHCPPAAQESARVADVIDGDTLQLEDGRLVRLVSALVAKPLSDVDATLERQLGEAARIAVAQAAAGAEIALSFEGDKADRYGRLLAQAAVVGTPAGWLQAMLVDRGLARVYSLVDKTQCVGVLLNREAAAREAGIGLWSTPLGIILRADRPGDLADRVGQFAIVEGEVVSVGDRPRRVYLNFGTYWSQDFTVFVDRGDVRRFSEKGLDLTGLAGRRVRVRGWIREDRGPAIRMTGPEQLEQLEDD